MVIKKISDIKINRLAAECCTQDEVDKLAASVDELGLLAPIRVTEDNYLVDGYRRFLACQSLGHTKIDVVVVSLTEREALLAQIIPSRTKVPTDPEEYRRHLRVLAVTMAVKDIAKALNRSIRWVKDQINE